MKQISPHEVRIYEVLEHFDWVTSQDVATTALVAGRTARLHLRRFAELTVCDREKVFGGYRYRLSSQVSDAGLARITLIKIARVTQPRQPK